MNSLNSWIDNYVVSYGYIGMFIALLVNCMGVPIASEIILPFAGLAARDGALDMGMVIVVSIIAQVIGFSIAYNLAKQNGVEALEKYGKYLLISHKNIRSAQKYLKKPGSRIFFIGLLIPGVHGDMGYLAGFEEMKWYRFLPLVICGTTIWTIALVGLGYYAGGYLPIIEQLFGGIGTLVFIGVVALVVFWYSRRHWANKTTAIRKPR